MYHFHCHLYFLKGSTVWISPLAVLWGITKVNCSFTGTGEVTAATPIPSLPSSFHPSLPTSSNPLDFSFPLASSLYCTNASCHWWSHLGLVCDLLVSLCKDRADTVQSGPSGKPTTRDLSYIDAGNMSLHIPIWVLSSLDWWDEAWLLERHGHNKMI